MSASEENGTITFEWSGATDDLTPEGALRYYFRAGSAPGAKDLAYYPILSSSWKLAVTEFPDNIYWGISSIDASKAVSAESEEQVHTTLGSKDFNATTTSVYPNPVENILNISGPATVEAATVYTLQGQQVLHVDSETIDFSNYPAGLYVLKISFANGSTSITKILKK